MADPSLLELEHLLGDMGLETPVPQFSGTDVLAKPIDIYRSYLANLVAAALGSNPSLVYEAINSTNDISLGDLAVVLPRLKLSKEEMKSLPLELKTRLPPSPLFVAPFLDGVHLRFLFSRQTLPRLLLSYISARGESYGSEPTQGLRDVAAPEKGRVRAVVDFSSPNMVEEFSDAHLRSTFLGAFVSNLFEIMGWDVVRLNYLGDWGKNVGLLSVGWERYGSEEQLAANPVGHMQEVYGQIKAAFRPEEEARDIARRAEDTAAQAEIEGQGIFAARDEAFKKLEDGDEAERKLWQTFRDITVADLSTAYSRLGIKFDEYSGESKVKVETMQEVEATLKEKGVLEEIEGAWVLNFDKHTSRKGLGTVTMRQRTGITTYLLRDVAAVLDRERAYNFDRMLYVVSSRQDSHFNQLFETLDLLGRRDLREKLEHVSFGKITGFAEHTDAPLLGGILDTTSSLMLAAMHEDGDASVNGNADGAVGDVTAVAALLAQDMGSRRAQPSHFDPKRMVNFEADTGIKLHLSLASLKNTIESLRTVVGDVHSAGGKGADVDYGLLDNEEVIDLLRVMAQYPDVTAQAFRPLEPHTVLQYLYRLVYAVGVCLSEDDDDEDEAAAEEEGESSAAGAAAAAASAMRQAPTPEEMRARLALYEAAKQVLENGMRLLGFPLTARSAEQE